MRQIPGAIRHGILPLTAPGRTAQQSPDRPDRPGDRSMSLQVIDGIGRTTGMKATPSTHQWGQKDLIGFDQADEQAGDHLMNFPWIR